MVQFLDIVPPEPIQDVTYLNTELAKKHAKDKNSRLDVVAKIDDAHVVNIEIQLRDEDNIEKRLMYYWANLFVGGLKAGQDYSELKKTISIGILDFNFDEDEDYHSMWITINPRNKRVLPEFEMHIIELKKIAEQIDESDPLSLWAVFMNNPENLELNTIAAQKNPILLKARDTLMKLSHDPDMRYLWFMKEKEEHDKLSSINYAAKKNRAEGIEEGKILTARNLLPLMDDATIATMAELDIETVAKLRLENEVTKYN